MKRCEASPKKTFPCLDYSVPMKDGRAVTLKTLNWRTVLADNGFKKQLKGQSERTWFLNCLALQKVPFGTESKYFNSLAFFDACKQQSAKRKKVIVRRNSKK